MFLKARGWFGALALGTGVRIGAVERPVSKKLILPSASASSEIKVQA
ncbi:hypothetical protein LJJ44_23815 [Pseudomonas sp. B24_DOA]|nr:hypothetical protein LJJ44_23815 [Pseudomonas sp. B24_DOA]